MVNYIPPNEWAAFFGAPYKKERLEPEAAKAIEIPESIRVLAASIAANDQAERTEAIARAIMAERAACAMEVDRLKLNYDLNSPEAMALQNAGIAVALGK